MTSSSFGEYVEQLEHSYIASGGAKWYNHSGKQLVIIIKLNIYLTLSEPAIALLGIYPLPQRNENVLPTQRLEHSYHLW